MVIANAANSYRMLKNTYYALGAVWAAINKTYPVGKNIYSEDWDICIILDSTRLDMLAELAPAEWRRGDAWSRGSVTTEWLSNTFTDAHRREISNTAYVTANPHSDTVFRDREWLTNQGATTIPFPSNPAVTPQDFAAFHEIWRTHATTHDTVKPETMRKATAEAYLNGHDRVVSHWLQPHEPFIAPDAEMVGGSIYNKNVWDGLNSGQLDEKTVWQSYLANLEFALSEVKLLLQSVDASVLITSDHGNAFNEWGVYGHPFGWPQPAVRRVPWYLVDATAINDVAETHVLDSDNDIKTTRREQLDALGYL